MTDEHTRIEELLSAMQDGAATPADVALVERHLATCARCRATANAFAQLDREVRRYLMATPVPEIAAPWRAEPLLAAPARPRTSPGHWRITFVGLALIFVLLFAGTALTFLTRDTNRVDGLATGATTVAQAAVATRETTAAFSGAAPSAAASARAASGAAASSAANAAASAAPAAAPAVPRPSAAASSAASASAAASAAAAASSGGGAAPSAAASAAASSAAVAPPSTATRSASSAGTPAAGGPADRPAVNPVQAYRLDTATALTLCRPGCDSAAQPGELLRQVVATLDRPLPAGPSIPASTVTTPYVTLRFALADGRTIDIGYYLQVNELQLPDGRGLVLAPPDFVAALAGVVGR